MWGISWCLPVGDGRLARSRGVPAVCRPRGPAVHGVELVRLGAAVVGVVSHAVAHTEYGLGRGQQPPPAVSVGHDAAALVVGDLLRRRNEGGWPRPGDDLMDRVGLGPLGGHQRGGHHYHQGTCEKPCSPPPVQHSSHRSSPPALLHDTCTTSGDLTTSETSYKTPYDTLTAYL